MADKPKSQQQKQYGEGSRYGANNQRQNQLDRDRDFSGVAGYPSDSEYMKTVGDAGLESQQNAMRQTAREAGDAMAEKAKPKGKKHHLHEIRSTQAEDGSVVHHHTYKEHADSPHTMPERGPMATSSTPEEAGQHVQDMFSQNQGGGGQAPEGAGAEPGGEGEPEEA